MLLAGVIVSILKAFYPILEAETTNPTRIFSCIGMGSLKPLRV